MGLFSKVFGKETCAICGTEVGALKKRALADGAICKDCASLLSPWFEDRKKSTVADIESQLADREQNKQRLAQFTTTHAFGDDGVVFIDRDHGAFCPVTSQSSGLFSKASTPTDITQVVEQNPDVLPISSIQDIDLDIVETRHEQKQTKDGEQVSYDPKHYVYMFVFTLVIRVEHPYIETIRLPLNDGALHIKSVGERQRASINQHIAKWVVDSAFGWEGMPLIENRVVYDNESLLAQLMRSEYEIPEYMYGFKVDQFANWEELKRYNELLAIANAIRDALQK